VLFGQDVFDMKSEEIEIGLMHPAIFTAVFGPLPNERPDARINHQAPSDRASLCRALDLSRATKVPKET
jgi:hypothetical protein